MRPARPAAPRALPLAALAALAVPAAAGSTAELHRSGGVIGETVVYDLQGDAGEVFVLAVSFTAGPTPLALFDPADPRWLSVGLELFAVWQAGVLDGAGQATVPIPVPLQVELHGKPIHAQLATLPGAATLVDALSAPNAFVLGLPQASTFTVADHPEDVNGHTATTLEDGSVLLAGGVTSDELGQVFALDRYYRFDEQTGAFELLPVAMQHSRTYHTAVRLLDGRVMTAGGSDENGVMRRSGEVYDPVAGTVAPIADMAVPRGGHTATLLPDGRVFVAGGASSLDFSDPLGALGSVHTTTEVWDPATGAWTPGPDLPEPRGLHTASLLGDGRVLLAGGLEVQSLLFVPVGSISDDALRYDPATDALLPTPSFDGPRGLHAQATLPDGRALLVGGVDGDLVFQSFHVLASCRVYDPAANAWSAAPPLGTARGFPALVVAGDTLVVIGGTSDFDLATLSGPPVDAIEASAATLGGWTTTGTSLLPRSQPRCALFDGGERILTTHPGDNGTGGSVPDHTAEIYVP